MTPLSDISIITALPVSAWSTGVQRIKNTVCLVSCRNLCQSVCLLHRHHIHPYLSSCFDIWFCFSLLICPCIPDCSRIFSSSLFLLVFLSPSSMLSSPRLLHPCCFRWSLHPISARHLILLPICPRFASCLFVWKWSMSCTKTIWRVCWENSQHVLHIIANLCDWWSCYEKDFDACVCLCVCQIWRRPMYRPEH